MESFLVVVVVKDICCCKVSTVIPNSLHEGHIKFISWGRLYEDRSACSTSKLFLFYLMYLLALVMKLTGCFTILEISPSLFFKIWDKTVIMYLLGMLFCSKKWITQVNFFFRRSLLTQYQISKDLTQVREESTIFVTQQTSVSR